jgi:hypothetical protein
MMVGRTPWSAADAHVGLLDCISLLWLAEERVLRDPRGPGGPPHEHMEWIPGHLNTNPFHSFVAK